MRGGKGAAAHVQDGVGGTVRAHAQAGQCEGNSEGEGGCEIVGSSSTVWGRRGCEQGLA